jgi:flagellar hook-associated protein 1 FlgK
MSNFVSLNTALSGIRAAQLGLDTASHNVANASTPGFTRQRIDLLTSLHYASVVGPMGTGVTVEAISRSRDAFLDARARVLSGEAANALATFGLGERVESVLAEPDNGISEQLGQLWDAFEELATDPGEGATRQQVVTALGSLSGRVRGVADGFAQLGRDTTADLANSLDDANALLARVADLNRQVSEVQLRQGTPNDLLDQRDLALDGLAELLGAEIRYAAGDAEVWLGGEQLVDGTAAATLTFDALSGEVQADGTDVTAGGEIGAVRDFLVDTLPQRHSELDAFVTTLVDELNDRHAQGFAPDGSPGGALLDYDPVAGAASLAVAAGLTPAALAAAEDPSAPAHDGRNATLLAAMRDDVVGATTLDQAFAAIVVRVAGEVRQAAGTAESASALQGAARMARQGMHGVSLDEEMVSLVQYQRSLEASSRVMTAVDQALDTLINRTGVVGR